MFTTFNQVFQIFLDAIIWQILNLKVRSSLEKVVWKNSQHKVHLLGSSKAFSHILWPSPANGVVHEDGLVVMYNLWYDVTYVCWGRQCDVAESSGNTMYYIMSTRWYCIHQHVVCISWEKSICQMHCCYYYWLLFKFTCCLSKPKCCLSS